MSKDVGVTLKPNPPPKWKLIHPESTGNDPQGYPIVKLDPGNPYLVIFDLPGGHKFDDDPGALPIWVDTTKPQSQVLHDQIADWKLFDNGKKLVILDKNTLDVDLHYQLNFKGPQQSETIDPIIDNGGTRAPIDYTGLVIALVVGLIAGFLLHDPILQMIRKIRGSNA